MNVATIKTRKKDRILLYDLNIVQLIFQYLKHVPLRLIFGSAQKKTGRLQTRSETCPLFRTQYCRSTIQTLAATISLQEKVYSYARTTDQETSEGA